MRQIPQGKKRVVGYDWKNMLAAILNNPKPAEQSPLALTERPTPAAIPGHIVVRVLACGVCRTDLHIVEGELPFSGPVIPGHQIVGEVVETTDGGQTVGSRVGVSWMGGVDGTCRYCRSGDENLCDAPVFTGYSVNGGFAEFALVRSDFAFPLPADLDDLHAAPLLARELLGFGA